MKKNILIAFLLNLFFSVFELVGGFLTGSVAILSDSLHDFGDALSIGLAVILEKKSTKKPDNTYTYGYIRYSVLAGVITTVVLLSGSVVVIVSAIKRILNPIEIDYSGMIVFAIVGVIVNSVAAFVTHSGHNLNEKAINLHMLEDVLGWVVVLVGAVVMKFTDISVIDPILSLAVAVFILINATKNLLAVLDIFTLKTPKNMDIDKIKASLCEIEGVIDAHHIHISALDAEQFIATLHIVTDSDFAKVKGQVKHTLEHFGISHTTVELENPGEECGEKDCVPNQGDCHHHHHHHHHH